MTYAEAAARLEALPEKSKGYAIWIAIDGRKTIKRLTYLFLVMEWPQTVEIWLRNYHALPPADQQKIVILGNRRTGAELEVYDVLPPEKRHVIFKARHKAERETPDNHQQGLMRRDTHEGIISREVWDHVQDKLNRRSK